MIRKFFMPKNYNMQKTYLWTMLAGLIYAGSSFVMSMATTKFFGKEDGGIIALALSIGSQLVTIGYFNIRTFQASDVKEEYSFGDYAVFRIITTAAMIAVGAIWIIKDSFTGVKAIAIGVCIGFRVLESIADLLEGRYQQKGRYDVSCRGVFVKTLVFLLAFLVAFFVSEDIVIALLSMTVCYALSIIIIDGGLIGDFGGVSLKSSFKKQKGLFIAGLPLFTNQFLNMYIINASKYSVERNFGEATLATYNALYMMTFVVNMFSSFVLKPTITALAQRYNANNLKGFLNLILRQVAIILGLMIMCLGGAYVLGIPVLSWLFGIDLSAYKGALCLMVISGGFTAFYQLFQYGIIVMRHQYSTFACCIITAVITYFITPILTRKYGILGASASYSISIVFMSVLFTAFFAYHFIKEKHKNKNQTSGGL
ncbi:MAG: lipopolysaccharide biosynthesis protein [Clostridia bacterium]|nr:lipopolysaccharide biosynthesis protein [Clostridia bacterium]